MKMRPIYCLVLVLFILSCTEKSTVPSYNTGINITPKPNSIQLLDGGFEFNKNSTIVLNTESARPIATLLNSKLITSNGLELPIIISKEPKDGSVFFELDSMSALPMEGYELNSNTNNITIKASTHRGLFYGAQTLLQLLPAEIESKHKANSPLTVPNVAISDAPSLKWRGMMLDVGRHFLSIEFIKKQLDVMAMYKLNKFHWHLTEDQGWRIEIKKYPELTAMGSTRIESNGTTHQGYYTQEEIKEVVAYAKERHIDVIPEIEMPGHALAAIAAFPELSCTEEHHTPRIIWGVEEHIFCAGKEGTFTFIENVLDEVIALFPYEYIHIGGDEAPKHQWEKCSLCQSRINSENLTSENELQGYFVRRVEDLLKSKNKKMIGWDEILEGGVSETASIMSWRGEEGGISAANKGNDVIMTPAKYTYLNFYQGDYKVLPIAFGSYISTETLYEYNPIPDAIHADKKEHILGAQCNLWTEYIYADSMAENQLYPRLLALAETTWTNAEQKDYNDFKRRLANQYVRLDGHAIDYFIPYPEGGSNHVAFTDSVALHFTTPLPVAKMVYTTDGSNPSIGSATYTDTLTFRASTELKIAAVLASNKMGPIRTINIEQQSLLPAHTVKNAQPGLKSKSAYGKFLTIKDLDQTNEWKNGTVDSIEQANTTLNWGHYIDENNFRAVQLTGYINLENDGVYYFSSDQEQVWIADKLIVDNNEEIKRHSRKDGAIALAKGKHPLKLLYFNNIYGGWASDWNTVELRYRHESDSVFHTVGAPMLSY